MSWNDNTPDREIDPPDHATEQEPEFDADKYFDEKYDDEYQQWIDRRYRGIVRRDLNQALISIGSSMDRLAQSPMAKEQAE